jgi:Na+/melibiose symporter-like transporter
VRLGWVNFGLSNLGVLIMIPALAKLLSGDKAMNGLVIAGTMVTILGMLSFAVAVFSLWAKPKAAV